MMGQVIWFMVKTAKSQNSDRSKLENGRYGHAPIRSDTSIRVYTTADTDTSTPCVGVPALVILDQAGRLENAAYTQWVAHADH